MATLIDGKKVAAEIFADVKARAEGVARSRGRRPGLATVLVGEDPASHVYVGQKIKKCHENGVESIHCPLPATISAAELLETVSELNKDMRVDGMIVQLPLPKGIDPEPIIRSILPSKDADGLHPLNQGIMGRLKSWAEIEAAAIPLPCTPAGVIELLLRYKVDPRGKHAVVVGRSTLVGKPVAQMLLSLDATVTVVHSRTRDLPGLCRQADILVAAIGQPAFIQGDWVKPGAVVIDVGINRTDAGLIGDVDYKAAFATAAAMTPVPGGVGPMTVAMLLKNTVQAAERLKK